MTTPTLDDDRIDAMRAGVMHAVDGRIRRRGRRTRRVIGLGAASVLVVGVGAYALALGGLAPAQDSDRQVTQADAGSDSGSSGAARDDAGGKAATSKSLQNGVEEEQLGPATEGGEPRITGLASKDADREVITTGTVEVTVEQPRQVAEKLSDYVEGIGGRVDSRTESGTGKRAGASLVVRIPSTRLSAAVSHLKTYGTVETVSLQHEDVTATSHDLDARIDALRLSIGRLEKILAEADTSREVIAAEGALTKRQEQLERLESQQRSLAGQVELSTVEINLAQVVTPRVESVEPGGFQGGLRDGWNGLVSTVNHIVQIVGTALPWLVLLAVVVGAVRIVARRRR